MQRKGFGTQMLDGHTLLKVLLTSFLYTIELPSGVPYKHIMRQCHVIVPVTDEMAARNVCKATLSLGELG